MGELREKADGVPFGRYRLRRRIARGGMGEVFVADQWGPRGPVREVAIKRMLPHFGADSDVAALFLEEMETAAQLTHPNIATTYDFGEIDGQSYIAMELIDGASLKEILAAKGPLSADVALTVVAEVAGALEFAHTRKAGAVVHRDVSPHNVMISTDGDIKLLDFGIARAEAAVGRVDGKRAYAAPEQVRGDAADRRVDVWALGIVLHELLTGHPPGPDGPRPTVEGAANGIIARALEPNPDDRWSSAEAMRQASLEARTATCTADVLAALVPARETEAEATPVQMTETIGALAEPEPPKGPTTKPASHRSRAAFVALAVALLLVAAWFVRGNRADRPKEVVKAAAVVPTTTVSVAVGAQIEKPRSSPTGPPAPRTEVSSRAVTKTVRRGPKVRKPGAISVMSVPWGRVEIDGKPAGTTPLAGRKLSAGRHRIRIMPGTGGFAPKSFDVRIEPERERKVVVRFATDQVQVR